MALLNAKKIKEELTKRLLMYAATNNLLITVNQDLIISKTGEVAFLIKIKNRGRGKTKLEQDWIDNGKDQELLHRCFSIGGKTYELMGWNDRAYTRKVVFEETTTRKRHSISLAHFGQWKRHIV